MENKDIGCCNTEAMNRDEGLLELNRRYQALLNSKVIQKHYQSEEYRELLENKQYKVILFRIFGGIFRHVPSSTAGNVIYKQNKRDTAKIKNPKIAVYSCIVGQYDKVKEPLYIENDIHYIMFTDQKIPQNSVWKKRNIFEIQDLHNDTPLLINRKIKIYPYMFLDNYDYSVYIDGSIELVGSMVDLVNKMGTCGFGVHYHKGRDCIYDEYEIVKRIRRTNTDLADRQIKKYKKAGFPSHYGMYENTILIRNHHDESVKQLMHEWMNEYIKYPTRDQISLPYVIWKNNFNRSNIYIVGKNIDLNPYFIRNKHNTSI